jgi:cysteine desulfurase family protein
MIYLDNAATTFPKPESVYQAVDDFNRTVGANPGRSGYPTARAASKIVAETRGLLAQLFHVQNPNQIVFTANATEAINLGLKGLLKTGDHVVTTVTEHNSMLRPLRSLEESQGIEVSRVQCDGNGHVDPEDVYTAIRPNTKLVCITHASNVTGTIHDIKAISDLIHENDMLLMVDAAQTAGCVPIDIQEMDIDLLAFTGHKGLYGPQGTGGLYIRPGLEVKPYREGGTGSESSSDRQPQIMPDLFEGGTLNTPGIAGLGAGVRFVLETGVEIIHEHEKALIQRLIERLLAVKGGRVYGSTGVEARVAVVSFTVKDLPPLNLAHLLASGFNIATRSGLHCAPLIHHYIGTAETGSVRASMGYFNTADEMDCLGDALEKIVTRA